MKIKNKTRKTILAENYKVCSNFLSQSLGLMFRKKLHKNALIFIFHKGKIIPLHMLFVFHPIDVLYIDKDKKVVEIKENLKPFSFYTPKNKAVYIIELPAGTIKKTKTKPGDRIEF